MWNGCPTALTSSLDVGGSSLSLGVSLAADCILSAVKGCRVTFLLSKVICAAGSAGITFPGSTVSHHIAGALPRLHSTLNSQFHVQTLINAFLSQIPYLDTHKLRLHMPRFYILCCRPTGGLSPVHRSHILPRMSGVDWIWLASGMSCTQ